jgi:hypothetical protein
MIEAAKRKGYAARPANAEPSMVGVIHGMRSGSDVHQLAQRHRHLSIASPFSSDSPNNDVRVVGGLNRVPVGFELEERTLNGLRTDLKDMLVPAVSRNGRQVRLLAIEHIFPTAAAVLARAMANRKSRLAGFAVYEGAMAAEFDVLGSMFPGIQLLLSEADAPYGVGVGRPRVADATRESIEA